MARRTGSGSIANDFFYCICSGSFVVKDPRYKPLVCKTCNNKSHRECTKYSGDENYFECMLCKVHLLDPFNTVEDFLWYDCIGNTSSYFVVDASNLRKWRSTNKDIYMACIPLNKEILQHEWPKTFQLKINNDVVLSVKEPTWEHKRRDTPIKITYAMRTGENLVNILSTTYNEKEPLFLLTMFLSNQVTVDTIVNYVKTNYTIQLDHARSRIHSIVNAKIDDDEIMCMENTRKMELICPVTLDRIEIPARGRYCAHIQCYDLAGYLKVMERTAAFNMRWKCPECHLVVKPCDLVVDSFVENLLGELPNAKTIELEKDLTYRIVVETNTPVRPLQKVDVDVPEASPPKSTHTPVPPAARTPGPASSRTPVPPSVRTPAPPSAPTPFPPSLRTPAPPPTAPASTETPQPPQPAQPAETPVPSEPVESANAPAPEPSPQPTGPPSAAPESAPSKRKSPAVIELLSDDRDPEVIVISSDDDPAPGAAKPPKHRRPNAHKHRADRARLAEQLADSAFVVSERKRKRKLRKPPDLPDGPITIADSAIVDCVTTFNQQHIDACSKSAPSYQDFVLNPPVMNEANKT